MKFSFLGRGRGRESAFRFFRGFGVEVFGARGMKGIAKIFLLLLGDERRGKGM